MVWTAATMTILSLDTEGVDKGELVQDNNVTSFTKFVATGRGFPLDGSANFIFVNAHDATTNLKGYHIIPAENVRVEEFARGGNYFQEIRFEASLHERKSGAYHLVGWCQVVPEGRGLLVNQATTLENAFILRPSPKEKLDEALQGTGLTEEPE